MTTNYNIRHYVSIKPFRRKDMNKRRQHIFSNRSYISRVVRKAKNDAAAAGLDIIMFK